MSLVKWSEVQEEQLTDLITRRYISGQNVTLARFFMKKGCLVSAHSHENEQFSTVIAGAAKFVIDGKETVLGAGETIQIAPFCVHWVEALEDCEMHDVFAPARADWAEGRDAYLRSNGAKG